MNRATTLTLAVALGVTAIATSGRAASAAPPAGPSGASVVATSGCDRDALQAAGAAAFVGSPRTYRRCGREQGGESHLVAADFVGSATSVAFPPPSGDVPDGWTELVDDTGTLGISVPSTWTATDTSPTVDDKGTPQPMVSATTNESLFVPPEGLVDTYSVPGLIYYAVPVEAITPARLEGLAFTGDCTAGPIESYDDGAYVGYIQSFNGCGGTASRIVELVANPRLGSVTVVLLVQLTGRTDDASTLDGLLSAFVDFSGFDVLDIPSG